MTVIPAIDILQGECVRLSQGNYEEVTVYDADPVAVARSFAKAGATRIHLVDLDAAHGDPERNLRIIRKIRKAVPGVVLELGGGVRRDDDIETLLDMGIDRLVLGTTFARRPELVQGWSAHYGNVFLAGIDARDGQVYVSGWEEATTVAAEDLAKRAHEYGAAGIIYTSIARDGMLGGPAVEETNAVARAARLPVILSGGVRSMEDLRQVAASRAENLVGVIVGKALYEGRFDLEALFTEYPGEQGEW
ncbi:MAG: 1-(5-phosphoribosyl)-5-[(5-phosphoribosylamino)methylideneamino]imidazole-4-carboxamide isomerase [bacterium]